ncbi:hypothetical protein CAEBREN_01292 [Caenorhabditis brenneri]|uniref:Uncharacterized protein n=1 Tax=Caenorhabditis brenneri TaxID=135651 RepID=G0P826_CAEBE|nr:hypothetical protein CAEBREN_01292 [Caenorhabditis brenneri]
MADIPELTAPQIKVEIQEEMTPEEIKSEMMKMAKPIVDPVPLIDRLMTAMPVVELFKRQVDMFQREQNITPITSPLYMQFQIMKDYHRDLMKIQIDKLRGMATDPVNQMIEALGLMEDGDDHGPDLKNLKEIKEWVVNCHKMMEWGLEKHLSTGPPTMQVLDEYRQCFLGYKMLIRGALKAILFVIDAVDED